MKPRLVPALAVLLGLLAMVKAGALWQAVTARPAWAAAPAPSDQPSPGVPRPRPVEAEARGQDMAMREAVLAAAERKLAARIEELSALQRKLEQMEQARTEREEAGWRGMAKLYEGMRPRDAARIFDDLDMSVLVQLVGRMREQKAAPVIGAMSAERARELTAELARLRATR